MNRFVKYGTIAGIALILVGTGVAVGALAVGASPERITEYVNGRRLPFGSSVVLFQSSRGAGDTAAQEGMAAETAVPDAASAGGPAPETTGPADPQGSEKQLETSYPAVTDLDIHQRGGAVRIIDVEADVLTVLADGMQLQQLRYDATEHWQKLSIQVPAGADCEIWMPAGWSLQDIEVEVTGGSFFGEAVRAQKAEYKAMGGEISVSQASVDSLELDCEAGELDWTGVGMVPGKAEVECQNGTIRIRLPEGTAEEAFGYDLECKNGEISLPRFTLTGKAEQKISGGAGMPVFKMEVKDDGTIQLVIE